MEVELFSAMDGGHLLSSFVDSSEIDSEELLRVRWLPLESPSARIVNCSVDSELKKVGGVEATSMDMDNMDMDSIGLDSRGLDSISLDTINLDTISLDTINLDTISLDRLPRIFQATGSPLPLALRSVTATIQREPSSRSPLTSAKRRLCLDADLSMGGGDSSAIIPSSPTIPIRSVDKLESFGFTTKTRKMGGIQQRSPFSHWNLQTVDSFKIRRAVSEFSERTLTVTPSSGEVANLVNSNIGISHILPSYDSPRDAIKRISPQTMTRVLSGEFHHLYTNLMIVDCRYPYEYHGGHLPDAINVCSLDTIDRQLFHDEGRLAESRSTVVIFHCEFSSERAPRMALHVRNLDRVLNAVNYPNLHYPQMYILDGGYKNFFLQFPQLCDPPNQYVPMRNAGHRDELRHHQRIKFQDGQLNGKHRHKLRSCSLRKSHSIAMPHPVMAVSSYFQSRADSVMDISSSFFQSRAHAVMDGSSSFVQSRAHSVMDGSSSFFQSRAHSVMDGSSSFFQSRAHSVMDGSSSFFQSRTHSPAPLAPLEALSSDIGDVCDQTEGILQAAEGFLLTAEEDGRISK